MDVPTLTFRPLDRGRAGEIVAWRYDAPYSVYNLEDADLEALLDPANAYFAVEDETGDLVGFCCFGPDARVPGGNHSADRLDLGVGLRPDATGQGLGPALIEAALDFATRTYGVTRFGATVAAFNERALRAAQRAGFRESGRFMVSGREWVQLERP